MKYIVVCQRGGVSKKPPGLQAAARHGPGILKIEKYGPTTGPVLLRQGEPGTSQYVVSWTLLKYEFEISLFYKEFQTMMPGLSGSCTFITFLSTA